MAQTKQSKHHHRFVSGQQWSLSHETVKNYRISKANLCPKPANYELLCYHSNYIIFFIFLVLLLGLLFLPPPLLSQPPSTLLLVHFPSPRVRSPSASRGLQCPDGSHGIGDEALNAYCTRVLPSTQRSQADPTSLGGQEIKKRKKTHQLSNS